MKNFPKTYLTALQAAIAGAKEIMRYYADGFEATMKEDGSPVTQADLASSNAINEVLALSEIPVTGEESENADFEIRKNWQLSWCVDPLDGTKEFVKRNGEFCINIALIENNRPIFGLIASPVQNLVLFGGADVGVYFSELSTCTEQHQWKEVLPSMELNSPTVMASSRSHHSGTDLQFIQELRSSFHHVEFVKMGSALKFFELAKGSADVYPRFAPTMEWDIAAGQAILESLGGAVVHAETAEPLYYNKRNLKNPYFIAKTKAFLEWERQ